MGALAGKQKHNSGVRWIQEGFKDWFSVEAPKPHSGFLSGRFGSDSGGLPGCNSDFPPNIGVAQTVFLAKPCFCPVPERGSWDENGDNDGFAFYPLKTSASLLRPPKMKKMTKITQAKAWFTHGMALCSLTYII